VAKILIVLGTRPEAVKLAPLILALKQYPWEIQVVATGQHQEILHQTLGWFGITPDQDLKIMSVQQTLSDILSRALTGLEKVFQEEKPDLVLVQGDTSTTFAGALAAFYQKIPVGHVEAGLRTGKADDPFPEEMNRRLTSQLAHWHFAPTKLAVENLHRDGIQQNVYQTGNTVIDALLSMGAQHPDPGVPADWTNKRVLLATVHRRENWGAPIQRIAQAFLQLLNQFPDTQLVLPLHPNPTVREPLQEILQDHPRALLCAPLDYPQLVGAMQRCFLVLTDSGGIQEEAPALGKPVLVLRETTERPEAMDAGVACLVGTDTQAIVASAAHLLTDLHAYKAMACAVNPFGDGTASTQICKILEEFIESSGLH
jgi:UDP-N-acetylglucosamine 2-epimerase (non-hydrolysing)